MKGNVLMENDFWVRWKAQANAIAKIFCDYGAKVRDVDGSWSHTGETPEITAQKKQILTELDKALKEQQKQYVEQEAAFT